MAVAVIVDLPDGNEQRYEQVSATVFPDGKLSRGLALAPRWPDRDRLAGGERRAITGAVRDIRPRAAPPRLEKQGSGLFHS